MWGEIWGQFVWGGTAGVPLLGPIGLALLAVSFLAGGILLGRRRGARGSTWMAGALLCVLPLIALAGTVSAPHVFTNGQIADAGQVNENFDTLADAIPAGLSCPAGNFVSGFDAGGGLLCASAGAGTGAEIIGDFAPSTTIPLPNPGTGQFGARTVVRSIAVPAGDYLVVANGNLLGMDLAVAACDLTAFRTSDGFEFRMAGANLAYSVLGSGVGGIFNVPAPLVGQLPSSITPATIEYACQAASGSDADPRNISSSSLHAISAVSSSEQ